MEIKMVTNWTRNAKIRYKYLKITLVVKNIFCRVNILVPYAGQVMDFTPDYSVEIGKNAKEL